MGNICSTADADGFALGPAGGGAGNGAGAAAAAPPGRPARKLQALDPGSYYCGVNCYYLMVRLVAAGRTPRLRRGRARTALRGAR